MKFSISASAGIALLSAIAPFSANAATFDQLYVIGDSVVDPGNIFQLTGGLVPQTPPYAGRFSNGPLAVEFLAEALMLEPALITDVPSGADISDGIYAAIGGAGTGLDNIVAPDLLPNTGALAQAGALSALGIAPTEDALFFYLAGANDFAGGADIPPQTDIAVPLQNTAIALQLLIESGAQNILVSNLPDISQTPRFSGLPDPSTAALSSLIASYNAGLSGLLAGLSVGAPEVNITEFDLNGLFSDVIENPAQFGFSDVTTSCLSDFTFPVDADFTVCDAPDSFLFWDDFHPTTQFNALAATAVLDQLQEPEAVPESGMAPSLVALGAIAAGLQLRRKASA